MAFAAKPKPRHVPTHKKRTGTHHKHTTHYVKHYWPYLPMLFLVSVGLAVNALWQPNTAILGANVNLSASSLVSTTNHERIAANQKILALNAQLSDAAQTKAEDMAARNYWSHTAPDGKSPWYFIVASHYQYQEAGENLAYGFDDAQTVVNAWMNSPEHRKNLLDTNYREVGFGIAQSPNYIGKGPETIVVAMYGNPSGEAAVAGATSNYGTPVSQHVSRAQAFGMSSLVGGAVGMTVVMFVAVIAFLYRHGRLWHSVIARGEAFVIQHPLVDIAIVALGVAAFVLSRSAGFIL